MTAYKRFYTSLFVSRAVPAGLALVVLGAACGSGPAQGERSGSDPVARSTPRAGRPDAAPGPAARRPALLLPVSATFISPSTGWLLADRCPPGAPTPRCSVVLRKTSDGGRQWVPAPAPGLAGQPGSVAQVRFADGANGWVFGPGLWVTHNGGASWRQLSIHGQRVTSLEAADGRAVAVFTGTTTFHVYASAVGSDTWQPVAGASGPALGSSQETSRNPQIAIEGSAAYVASSALTGATDSPAGGGVLLSGPADGSAPWQRRRVPCPRYISDQMPVAAAPGELVLGCGGNAAMGTSLKYVYRSTDGGHTWATGPAPDPNIGELPAAGFLDNIAVTPAGAVVASGDREAYFSWDNGTTWHTPAALAAAVRPNPDGDSVLIGMTTSEQGFALPELSDANRSSWIWMTYDAGHTWTRMPLT